MKLELGAMTSNALRIMWCKRFKLIGVSVTQFHACYTFDKIQNKPNLPFEIEIDNLKEIPLQSSCEQGTGTGIIY